MNQKGSAAILIVILIALGVGGYLIYQKQAKPSPVSTPSPVAQVTTQPTPASSDETANWKTYTNTKFGYSLKYPSDKLVRWLDCKYEEDKLLLDKWTSKYTEDTIISNECGRDLMLPIEVAVYSVSIRAPFDSENYSVTKENILVGGAKATKYIAIIKPQTSGPFDLWYTQVVIERNNKTYEIRSGKKDMQTTLDQMLATFKFTD